MDKISPAACQRQVNIPPNYYIICRILLFRSTDGTSLFKKITESCFSSKSRQTEDGPCVPVVYNSYMDSVWMSFRAPRVPKRQGFAPQSCICLHMVQILAVSGTSLLWSTGPEDRNAYWSCLDCITPALSNCKRTVICRSWVLL